MILTAYPYHLVLMIYTLSRSALVVPGEGEVPSGVECADSRGRPRPARPDRPGQLPRREERTEDHGDLRLARILPTPDIASLGVLLHLPPLAEDTPSPMGRERIHPLSSHHHKE